MSFVALVGQAQLLDRDPKLHRRDGHLSKSGLGCKDSRWSPKPPASRCWGRLPVQIDDRHKIAHKKIMIIDGETVLTGSFNFTKAAEESNAENLLVIHSKDLAEKYTANWQAHAGHSVKYDGR
jgi:phosphatidylserine/phosphatidylglycerophosphate/cardiolipin synthase-like enzyme